MYTKFTVKIMIFPKTKNSNSLTSFKTSLFGIIICIFVQVTGQEVQELSTPNYIKTVEFQGDSNQYPGTPILPLGEPLSMTFDDIDGDEADYYYKISYYNFDWTPTQLPKNEFMDGFDDVRITNYENSFNALKIYSHYRLTIPNSDTRALKKSGNYILEIYNDQQEFVFSRKFIVYEAIATIALSIKRSRNLKFLNHKQSINFTMTTPTDFQIRNPRTLLKTMVIQNNNIKEAITDLVPQYTLGNTYTYRYDEESSFWGGNEFLNFDSKDLRGANINIARIELQDIYHHYLFTNQERNGRPYTYYPDINGHFSIRQLDAVNSDIEAEYIWMHFSLQSFEAIGDGDIHIYGNFNNYNIDESTKMTYNKKTKRYELTSLFKQGFYNYKYVVAHPDGTIDQGLIGGNFDETENEYTVLAYYRAPGQRYDRVIGIGTGNASTIRN